MRPDKNEKIACRLTRKTLALARKLCGKKSDHGEFLGYEAYSQLQSAADKDRPHSDPLQARGKKAA